MYMNNMLHDPKYSAPNVPKDHICHKVMMELVHLCLAPQ